MRATASPSSRIDDPGETREHAHAAASARSSTRSRRASRATRRVAGDGLVSGKKDSSRRREHRHASRRQASRPTPKRSARGRQARSTRSRALGEAVRRRDARRGARRRLRARARVHARASRATTRRRSLGLPEVQLGLCRGRTACSASPSAVGLQVALDLGLTGKNMRPAKAKKLGLVDEVVPAPILRRRRGASARELAARRAEARPQRPRDRSSALSAKELARARARGEPDRPRAALQEGARELAARRRAATTRRRSASLDVLERFGRAGLRAAAEARGEARSASSW